MEKGEIGTATSSGEASRLNMPAHHLREVMLDYGTKLSGDPHAPKRMR
jgi:hypothetical protein